MSSSHKRISRGFDLLANWYDWLVQLVFGKEVYLSQIKWLGQIPEGARVLIIGGGSGWILSEVLQRTVRTKVDYLELSPRMLELTRQQMLEEGCEPSRYVLRAGGVESLEASERYDAILTFFFLDLFAEDEADRVIGKLGGHLHPGGSWLFADFIPHNLFQRVLLGTMYAFFRLVCGISGSRLLPFDRMFRRNGLELKQEASFARRMIQSRIYEQFPL